MMAKCNYVKIALACLAIVAIAPSTQAALINSDVVGWVAHNEPSGGPAVTINAANTNSPTITPDDTTSPALPGGAQYVMMAPIDPVALTKPGDYVQFTVNVQMFGRTTTGAQNLNNNLRFGLFSYTGTGAFDGNSHDPVVAEDVTNHGIYARYGNGLSGANHLGVHEQATSGVNPFTGGSTNLLTRKAANLAPPNELDGPASGDIAIDVGGHSIAGANPGIISYDMTIMRTSDGKLNIFGSIAGDDYLSSFNIDDHTSSAYLQDGPFTFNRVGLFFNNASIQSGTNPRIEITNAQITTNVPEPGSFVLIAIVAGLGWSSRRAGSSARRS